MVSVEFNLKKKGTCQWCRKERDEIYDVTFGDKTFVGMLCKADLFRAIDMKLPEVKAETTGTATGVSRSTTHTTATSTANGQVSGESKQTGVSNGATGHVVTSTSAPK